MQVDLLPWYTGAETKRFNTRLITIACLVERHGSNSDLPKLKIYGRRLHGVAGGLRYGKFEEQHLVLIADLPKVLAEQRQRMRKPLKLEHLDDTVARVTPLVNTTLELWHKNPELNLCLLELLRPTNFSAVRLSTRQHFENLKQAQWHFANAVMALIEDHRFGDKELITITEAVETLLCSVKTLIPARYSLIESELRERLVALEVHLMLSA
jgi:hypothetical protein